MRVTPIFFFFLSLAELATAWRNKNKNPSPHRRLQDVCAVNHTTAKSSTEVNITVVGLPDSGTGMFEFIFHDEPYAPSGGSITTSGWCIDYERFISSGNWSMDVFSAFDPDIHASETDPAKNAVDRPEMLPNLAWLINNYDVGDYYDDGNGCNGTLTWADLQGAAWVLIDTIDPELHHNFYRSRRVECIVTGVAAIAEREGMNYEIDCTDPEEQVPLVLIIDDDEGAIYNQVVMSETKVDDIEGLCDCSTGTEITAFNDFLPPADFSNSGSGSGDPHFKTWTGEKFDYHGECDLVLIDNPTFNDGQGLKIHIRTTRVQYFSYIEKIALQIGDDVLEFENDVENFLVNGEKVEANRKHHKTMFAGFVVRRDKRAISVRLSDKKGKAKIDFHTRKNGFPAVVVDGGNTDIFKGSLGLLGDWSTGRRFARDRVTELNGEDATAYALEWQVRDTEPLLFHDARHPQFPTTCTPPKAMLGGRLGAKRMEEEAEKACAHWKMDKEDCIFDVIATRDVLVADEGHMVHVEFE